jgi:hypothetical protein
MELYIKRKTFKVGRIYCKDKRDVHLLPAARIYQFLPFRQTETATGASCGINIGEYFIRFIPQFGA